MKPKQTLRSADQLVAHGILPEATPALEQVAAQFAVSVTPAMAALIDPNDPNDPIARQFVPSADELTILPEERHDPIGDDAFSPVQGIVHRYPDRALLKLLHSCPVYCRFCFRREMIGPDQGLLPPEALTAAMDYIRAHDELWEIILTGGDPLMLSDRRLGDVIAQLNAIPHVKIIRIHTRVPVVDPARITKKLVKALRGRAPVYVMLHCNHPRELTPEAREACALLSDHGVPLLSQSVLLRGVNDSAATLAELMRAFVEARVKPHYLHHTDMARGTSHFRVPLAEAQDILRQLRGNLSGLCQPTFMLDIPGGHGKVPVGPVYAEECGGEWAVHDYKNRRHAYGAGHALAAPNDKVVRLKAKR